MPHSISLRGTITECTLTTTPSCEKVVYQKTAPGFGNLPGDGSYNYQRRKHVVPINPNTAAQQMRRSRFALAVQAWQTMSPADKTAWRDAGRNRGLPAYQTFLSAFLKA